MARHRMLSLTIVNEGLVPRHKELIETGFESGSMRDYTPEYGDFRGGQAQ